MLQRPAAVAIRGRELQSLLVDDDRQLCELLRAYLELSGFDVEAVHSGEHALRACRSRTYDIVLLDVMLPRRSGYDVLSGLRKRSQVPVIMLTAKGDEQDRVRGLDAGADDYLSKPFSSRELVARMNALLRRTRGEPSSQSLGDLHFRAGHNEVLVGDHRIALTSVEHATLRELCAQPGSPVARDHLYRAVLQREHHPFDRSLDTHVSNLRKKLGRRDDGSARIVAVRGIGYQYCP